MREPSSLGDVRLAVSSHMSPPDTGPAAPDTASVPGEGYYGKYRGVVMNNVDPQQIGRIQVAVPGVTEIAPTSWAMPCVPVAGLQMGVYLVPPVGARVWVEFEQGDPEHPVWVGCFWVTAAELPVLAHLAPPGVDSIAIQTTRQNGLVVSDLPGPTGGIMIKSAGGATLIVNDSGIYIQNGKGASVTLVGPTVAITPTPW